MTDQLTVIIPCKNERPNIRPCIESAKKAAGEILVADSGSTDGTLDIVREIGGCRVIEREYVDSGDFKNWAIPQASRPWVLILDADERITDALATEIRQVIGGDAPRDGYWVYRNNYFMGHRIRFSGWNADCCLRLFRRDLGRYPDEGDHSELVVSTGNVGRLRARSEHFGLWSYDQYFPKFHRYTTWKARRWYEEGRRPNLLRMLLGGPLRFLHAYIIRLGFLDGMAGIQICVCTGFYSFMKEARLWELHHARRQPDPETERANVLRSA